MTQDERYYSIMMEYLVDDSFYSNFKGSKIGLIFTNIGALEASWNLEILNQFLELGIEVDILDVSDIASLYARRLRTKKFFLPRFLRPFFRRLLIPGKSRLYPYKQLSSKYIRCSSIFDLFTPVFAFGRTISVSELNKYVLSESDSLMVKSFLSGVYGYKLEDNDKVLLIYVLLIKKALKLVRNRMSKYRSFYDVVFISNGRTPIAFALNQLMKETTEVWFYESGGGYIFPELNEKRLDFFRVSSHDIFEAQEKVKSMKVYTSEYFYDELKVYEQKITGGSGTLFGIDWIPNRFETSMLERIRNHDGRVLSYFASSEWEVDLINPIKEELKGVFFQTQFEVIDAIIALMLPTDLLCIRIHPFHPLKKNIKLENEWAQYSHLENVIVVGPRDPFDSYALGSISDINIVWTSFIGFEFALKGFPVIVTGNPVYAPAVGNFIARNTLKLKRNLSDVNKCKFQEPLLYLAYLKYSGAKIKNSELLSDNTIDFRGRKYELPRFKCLEGRLLSKIR